MKRSGASAFRGAIMVVPLYMVIWAMPDQMRMILIAALIVAIVTSALAHDYWNRSIATQLNPSDSSLLAGFGTINAIKLRLAPFRLVGMTNLFTGIGLALAPIVQVLRWQSNRLWNILS